MPLFGHAHGLSFLASSSAAAPAWTPLDLGADVLALFRASSVGSSPVATWPDDAPVPHDATQGTAGRRPVTGTINSSAAVVFDGTDDRVENSDVLTPASGKFTVAIGYQVTTLPTGSYGGAIAFRTSLGTFDLLVMNSGGYRSLSFVIDTNTMVGADTAYNTSVHRVIIRYNGGTVTNPANWSLTVDGSTVAVVASGFAGVTAGTAIGSRAGGGSPLAVKVAAGCLINDSVDGATVTLLDEWLQGVTA